MGEGTLMRGRSAIPRPAEGSPRRLSRLARATARGRREERGTALVEFALVSPLLFLLVLGILDFGRALNYYNNLTQLVGQGARAAAVNRSPNDATISTDGRCTPQISTNNSIQCQLVNDYTSSPELKNGIQVCIPTQAAVTAPVTVTASYAFNLIPFIGGAIHAAQITLTASQTERQEAIASYSVGCITGS
jgi:Flp pilus assembly protein TadG